MTHYSLANLPPEKTRDLFEESIACLNEIGITYKDWGYRAGGWCIQPFSLLEQNFISNKIKFDFSVLPECKNDSPYQAFDFSMVKNDNPYTFSDKVELPDDTGGFFEFPISTIKLARATQLADKIIRKYLWRTGDKGWGDGIGAQATPVKFNYPNQEMISIELLNKGKLHEYKRYLKNKEYMHWISHPKMITRHGLAMFDSFLEFADKRYSLVFDFQKMI